jgi:putative transposase
VGRWETYYHLVWATKGREPIIDAIGQRVIDRSFRDTCREADVVIRAIGIMPDHVHLALSIPPRWSVSEIVKELKISATHSVRKSLHLPYAGSFMWQHEFGVFTFGRASLENVIEYVENQRQHHASQMIRPVFEQIDR